MLRRASRRSDAVGGQTRAVLGQTDRDSRTSRAGVIPSRTRPARAPGADSGLKRSVEESGPGGVGRRKLDARLETVLTTSGASRPVSGTDALHLGGRRAARRSPSAPPTPRRDYVGQRRGIRLRKRGRHWRLARARARSSARHTAPVTMTVGSRSPTRRSRACWPCRCFARATYGGLS